MCKLLSWIFLLGIMMLSVSAVAAERPVRLALGPVPSLVTPKDHEALRTAAALYLRERLTACPGVRVVSQARSDAIVAELTSGVRDGARERMLAVFSEYVPIDAYLEVRPTTAGVALLLFKGEGFQTLPFGVADYEDPQALVHALGAAVAERLNLKQADRELLSEKRFETGAELVAYHAARVTRARWPNNMGEAQLKVLQPVYKPNASNPRIAAQVLRSAAGLLSETRREQEFSKRGTEMAQFSIVPVLGTPFEPAAYEILRRVPEAFEGRLLEMAQQLKSDDPTRLEDIETEFGPGGAALPGELATAAGKAKVTRPQRIGALRLLAVMQSPKAVKLLQDATGNREADLREAAAFGWRFYEKDGLSELKRLAGDRAPQVAFTAQLSLLARGQEHPSLLDAARRMALNESAERRQAAAEVLARCGGKQDVDLLKRLLGDVRPEVRTAAAEGLVRIAPDEADLQALMNNPHEQIVMATLRGLPKDAGPALVQMAMRLVDDPFGPVGQAARLALAPHRPEGERDRIRFDLTVEHPYLRLKLIERLSRIEEPWATDLLADAAANRDAHVRSSALAALTQRDPERAQALLLKALKDPYRWVRLHAAALLASRAAAGSAQAIEAAVTAERDQATRLYLRDALARVLGKKPPAAPPAAHSVKGKQNIAWLCGHGLDAPNSPFDAYYMFRTEPNDTWKQAHAKGKIFFSRVSTTSNPGLIIVDRAERDRFWLLIEREVLPENLPWIDGLVFGEESMRMAPDALWPAGWRLFCIDSGIDPARVDADPEKLTPPEQRAWRHWALSRCVDGFNKLYDYVHLRYGRLRPGIQVCTFLPEQGHMGPGSPPNDLEWRFDVGGIYHYKTCTRTAAYTMVRRYKTLWPERPILWLSLGIGGYEMNPVKRTLKVPEQPLTTRGRRAWADSVTAWLAGADTGWFSTWIFVEKDFKGGMHSLRGVQIMLEDIVPDSPVLERAIRYAWRGAEEDYRKDAGKKPGVKPMTLDGAGEMDLDARLFEEDRKKEAERIKATIEEEIDKFRRGFFFYRKYVYDAARVLKSLPRNQMRPRALAVRPGISIWTRPPTPGPVVPGMALLNTYDFLLDINKCPRLDLSRYRLIVVNDPGALTDETIRALTKWLRETPGLLYVHRNIAASNEAEASSPEDHDGRLTEDWPWEPDISISERKTGRRDPRPAALELSGAEGKLSLQGGVVISTFETRGDAATTVFRAGDKACLVLWRKPDMKGAVLFDGIQSATQEYLTALKTYMNKLHAEAGIGLKLDGPILHQMLVREDVTAASSTTYYRAVSERHAYEGIDLLTGQPDPNVGGGRSAAIVSKDLVGRYVASTDQVAVLSQEPMEAVEKLPGGGLRIRAAGLIRAAARSGKVSVTADDTLPAIEEEPLRWVLFGTSPGIVNWTVRDQYTVTYVRARGPVEVRAVQQ